MRMGRTRISLQAFLTLVLLCIGACVWAQDSNGSQTASQVQVPQPSDGGVNWKGVGIGAGTVVTNLAYVPAKLVYGILGGLGGVAGYALTGGNTQVANSIWRSSLGGDYVLTPDMMTGQQPIYFSGPSTAGPMTAASPGNSLPPNNVIQSTPASLSSSAATGVNRSASTAAVPENAPAAHPIDSGTGFVSPGGTRTNRYGGTASPDYSYSGYSRSHAPRKSHRKSGLSDTSIE
jgi:hypothetical protein